MNERDQKIKEKLLMSLIAHMEDGMSDRLSPKKKMSVEVAAPDEEELESGLDKAKELLYGDDEPEAHESEDSDEDRLRALLADSEDEDSFKRK